MGNSPSFCEDEKVFGGTIIESDPSTHKYSQLSLEIPLWVCLWLEIFYYFCSPSKKHFGESGRAAGLAGEDCLIPSVQQALDHITGLPTIPPHLKVFS